MKIAIVINAQRVTPALQEKLNSGELSNKYQIEYDLFTPAGDEIATLLQSLNHKSYSAILIGGGDGTVRTAIQVLIDAEVPLIVLPLGTFNILATTLQYPADIDELFAIIKNNKRKQIDIVAVNEQIVINHAWIGFYYKLLKLREKHKDILGKNRFLKLAFNAFNLCRKLPVYHLEVNENNDVAKYDTCLIYVGNNISSANILTFGERQTLSAGLLDVAILRASTHWQLFKGMLHLLFSKQSKAPNQYIKRIATDHLTIHFKKDRVNVVLDGELFTLATPLHFKIFPKKLEMITP